MICIPLLNFLFCLCIVFLISLNCLSVSSCSSPSFLKAMTLNYLLHKAQISISLGLVTGKFLYSFGGVMFPWIFMFLEILHYCLHIWRSLLRALLTSFGRVVPSLSPVRDSLTFSDLFYGFTCFTLLASSWWCKKCMPWCNGMPSFHSAKTGIALGASHLLPPGQCWISTFSHSFRVGLTFPACSLAVYKGMHLLPSGVCTGSQPRGRVCVGVVCRTLGVPLGQLEGSADKTFPASCCEASWWSLQSD